jgi:hypothetical protein
VLQPAPKSDRYVAAYEPWDRPCWQWDALYTHIEQVRVAPFCPVEEQLARVHRYCHAGPQKEPFDRLSQAPPLAILLRGAPGSGKSTWAARYKAAYPEETVVISATNYFRGWDGVVRFQEHQLRESHGWCAVLFHQLLYLRTPRIVVDNTNLRCWEYATYWIATAGRAYRCFQKVCTGRYPNTNGVPDALVTRMRERFEQDTQLPHYQEEYGEEEHLEALSLATHPRSRTGG